MLFLMLLFGCMAGGLLVPWVGVMTLTFLQSLDGQYRPLDAIDYLMSWIWFMAGLTCALMAYASWTYC